MTANSLPEQSSIVNSHSFASIARWALRINWSTSPGLLLGIVGTTLASSLTPAGLALAARGLVNTLVASLDSGASDMEPLLPWLALGWALVVVEAGSSATNRFFYQRLYDEFEIRVTTDVLAHAAGLDVAFFEDPKNQDIIARAQRGTIRYFTQFVANCLAVIASIIQIVSLVGILVVIEPIITLALVPLVLPYLVFQWRLSRARYETEFDRTTKRRWTRYFLRRVTDQRWVSEVKLLGLAPLLTEQCRALLTEFRDQNRRLYQRDFIINFLFTTLTTSSLYFVLARVVARVLSGVLTVGDVAIYSGATARLRRTLQTIVVSTSAMREGLLYISNLREFMCAQAHIMDAPGLLPAPGDKVIELQNVSFSYPGSNLPVLTDVTLRIRPGETIALVGENGAGKTTLVKLIARLYDPIQGRILWDGIDLKDISLAYWRRQIGFVFQRFGLYEATAAENIAFGDWQRLLQDQEKVREIARRSNVHDMIQAMPQGYDTFLGRSFGEYTLSQGQWQQMAIARAFARQDAALLILDEPTSNLDARAEYELFCRFRELAAGRTTVLISHRFSTVSIADRILVLNQGRIVEQGAHQDLLAQGGYYASLYRLHNRQMTAPPPSKL